MDPDLEGCGTWGCDVRGKVFDDQDQVTLDTEKSGSHKGRSRNGSSRVRPSESQTTTTTSTDVTSPVEEIDPRNRVRPTVSN